jgi:hypothetical protein
MNRIKQSVSSRTPAPRVRDSSTSARNETQRRQALKPTSASFRAPDNEGPALIRDAPRNWSTSGVHRSYCLKTVTRFSKTCRMELLSAKATGHIFLCSILLRVWKLLRNRCDSIADVEAGEPNRRQLEGNGGRIQKPQRRRDT